jgi:tripartite-type tricarboxylate transporter receptor subunit TctC
MIGAGAPALAGINFNSFRGSSTVRLNRRHFVQSVAASLAAYSAPSARADDAFPSYPVRLIVPFAAGGSVDISARIVAAYLQDELGQPAVVENRAGAGGRSGAAYVASARPDGYTLLVGSSGSLTAMEAVATSLSYEVARDFTPIAQLNVTPMIVEVGAATPFQTLEDLCKEGKARPGTVTMASAGVGSSNHLAIELLQTVTGVKFLHVPYKGSGDALKDLVAGNVKSMIDQIASSMSYIEGKQLRPLAVMALERSALLPNVPTLKELGYGDAQAASFTGILAPKNTPKPVVEKLERAIMKAASHPEVAKRFRELAADPKITGGAEFGEYIQSDLARWKKVAAQANVSID